MELIQQKSSERNTSPQATVGQKMHGLMSALFPICRSITGDGVRKTLTLIKKEIPALKIIEIPSGTQAFDWTVPDEWNIRDAYVKDSKGNRVIDFKKSNLHVVGYSIPIKKKMTLAELRPFLHTLPQQPTAIPYLTSYYSRNWGFCLTHEDYLKLEEDSYEVCIDSDLKKGSLTLGEVIIPGRSKKEILLSTNICHPSLANNELSGPVVTTYLVNYLSSRKNHYTYRIVFIPETIGAVSYLNQHKDEMIANTVAGYTVTCTAGPGNFVYLESRCSGKLTDVLTQHVLRHSDVHFEVLPFTERGSDERQYCWPGIDLPIGSLMRSKYGRYPEYHNSLDNLSFVTPQNLERALSMYIRCLDALEANHTYRSTTLCEPQLGKRGLYPALSTVETAKKVRNMTNLLSSCDGKQSLLMVAEKLNVPIWELAELAEQLLAKGLLSKFQD